MRKLSATSKFNVQMDFLLRLQERGRNAADRWLKANCGTISAIAPAWMLVHSNIWLSPAP